MKQIGEHAVVIGASMGGLLAARALADFYATVTVLERDTFPLSDVPRKGVPQGRHAHGLLARGSGPNWRNGTILYQTVDRWIVSIGGYFGDIAPDDDQMFAAYAGSLPTSDIHDIVAHAEPLTDFASYRYSANLRRRYERLARFPKNDLVFGDSVCSFNPVYGQGMTVAAQEAALLRECLDAGDADLARRFFAAASTAIDTPWDIAVGNDLRHPQVQGPRSPKVRFINWYIGKLHMAARHDASLATAFLEVANLEAPPSQLLHPATVMRVLWGNFGWRRRSSGEATLAGAPA